MESYAVVAGVGEYLDKTIPTLEHINFALNKLSETLLAQGGFEERNLKILMHGKAYQDPLDLPLIHSILSFIWSVPARWDVQEEDFFLFYFIGHGDNEGQGDRIWTLDSFHRYQPQTTLPVSILTDLIRRRIRARRKLLVFDCCRVKFRGGQAAPVETFGQEKIEQEGFITLYACEPGQIAWIPEGEALSLLTGGFIRAVEDENCRSILDMKNAIDTYIRTFAKENYEQTPELVIIGQDKGQVGFLHRQPRAPKIDETFEDTIKKTRNEIHEKFSTEKMVKSPGVLMQIAVELNNWEAKLPLRSFRPLAHRLLEVGESADLYVVSYMLRQKMDPNFFEYLVEALGSRKHRGTAVWQALASLEEMLREKWLADRLTTDDIPFRQRLIAIFQKLAKEHWTKPIKDHDNKTIDHPYPFSGTVVWGKILQICRRLQIPEEEVFDEFALGRLRATTSAESGQGFD